MIRYIWYSRRWFVLYQQTVRENIDTVLTCDLDPPTSMIRHSVPDSGPASMWKLYSDTPTVFKRALSTSSEETRLVSSGTRAGVMQHTIRGEI